MRVDECRVSDGEPGRIDYDLISISRSISGPVTDEHYCPRCEIRARKNPQLVRKTRWFARPFDGGREYICPRCDYRVVDR